MCFLLKLSNTDEMFTKCSMVCLHLIIHFEFVFIKSKYHLNEVYVSNWKLMRIQRLNKGYFIFSCQVSYSF